MSIRKQLQGYIAAKDIAPEHVAAALQVSKLRPNHGQWFTFIEQLLLWCAALALVIAALFFIAYNWDDFGRFSKFAGLEVLVILAVASYLKWGKQALVAQVSLMAASIAVGVLLAFFGQTYQTGADPWQLFAIWAALILPWVIVGRFSALWMLWLTLVNLALVLWLVDLRPRWLFFPMYESLLWAMCIVNGLALVAWELILRPCLALTERWSFRLIATVAGTSLTLLALEPIINHNEYSQVDNTAVVVWGLWLLVSVVCYRYWRRDLFMLAGAALSFDTLVVCLFARLLLNDFDIGGFLVLALIIIGLGVGSAIWLRNVQRGWQQ
ncbi:DUF2157 domain-containing protein [Shewanella sp. SNU WT4]|uniref:DUF2157 domain-containing protein n=1 Tax=Shewanella sp. SNU WT4 TaxID=2590015 RepID=UPI00112CF276|nr:DUF2157 domain-containing protein [Shewanella sp. SNU WT4]QDF67971.1 DUF2157 domain-containing protein [Shewanella sp. SNU WT4]